MNNLNLLIDLEDLSIAALHFVNVYFYLGASDYFSKQIDNTFVLHYWSLAVEEQFYFILPVLFYFLGLMFTTLFKKTKLRLFAILSFISLCSMIAIFFVPPTQKFFMLYTRVWEFLAGTRILFMTFFFPFFFRHL